jgi:hypothetical protein
MPCQEMSEFNHQTVVPREHSKNLFLCCCFLRFATLNVSMHINVKLMLRLIASEAKGGCSVEVLELCPRKDNRITL